MSHGAKVYSEEVRLLLILAVFLFSELGFSRVVNSLEDEVRLKGWWQHQKAKEKYDKNRSSSVSEYLMSQHELEKTKEVQLKKYKEWKKRQPHGANELNPEYEEYLNLKVAEYQKKEAGRKKFINTRDETRHRYQSFVDLSEEQELDIVDENKRYDWRKRKLFGYASGGSSSSGGGGSMNFTPPSPSGGSDINPDVYESDIPPPPPMEPGTFDEMPPPPPPPSFDDGDTPF